MRNLSTLFLLFSILLCLGCDGKNKANTTEDTETVGTSQELKRSAFDTVAKSKIMIFGTYHFRQEDNYDELSKVNQEELSKIISRLAAFNPTKVVIEKEVHLDSLHNSFYQEYLSDDQALDTLPNETFQLGYRLAKKMQHDKIYLFDNKPEFIGSLAGFTWEKFGVESNKEKEFVSRFEKVINSSYRQNEDELAQLGLYSNLKMRNSPQAQNWNRERMHSYEIRVGIGSTWMGPDWLARVYQRNIRMMANIMAFNNPGEDRIVVIVGDNHKWILDQLLESNPEFEVVSSFDILN